MSFFVVVFGWVARSFFLNENSRIRAACFGGYSVSRSCARLRWRMRLHFVALPFRPDGFSSGLSEKKAKRTDRLVNQPLMCAGTMPNSIYCEF